MSRSFTFIGVRTQGSSIMRVFPRWRDALGLGDDVEVVGWDLPVDASDHQYAEAVARLADDPDNLGALVTTHKLGIKRAAADRFDELDENATLLDEVSCIAKRGPRLLGWAKDPVTSAAALEGIIEDGHFAGGAEALVMGAGGAGAAIAAYLTARRVDRPRRVLVTDNDPRRLEHLETIAGRLGDPPELDLILSEAGVNERLLASLPERSLAVNATGMGKDRPGSPLAEDALFPDGAVAWELNYRGELGFLHQAEAAQAQRGLTVADGWGYFIQGWAAVIEEVFERPLADDDLERLSHEAAAVGRATGGVT